MLASELVQCAKQMKKPMFVLKLDFQKAFDTVNWDCLLAVLEARGFDRKWINWIKTLLNSGSASVLINGQPGPFFFFNKG